MKTRLNERIFYSILSVILFGLGAFSFWDFIYALTNMAGSIVSNTASEAVVVWVRLFPMLLIAILLVYMACSVHTAFCATNQLKRASIWKRRGIVCIILGSIVCLYVIVGIITGEYEHIVEGYVTYLFPLDTIIYGVICILAGVTAVKYGGAISTKDGGYYIAPRVARNGRIKRAVNIWLVLSYLVSLCGFAAFVYGIFVLDFSHGAIFYNIMLLLNYGVAFVMFVIYRFVYLEKSIDERDKCGACFGIVFLVINIVLFVLYTISVNIYNEAPNQNALGLLPIEFAASFNAFPFIYGTNNLIAPLCAVIISKKRK